MRSFIFKLFIYLVIVSLNTSCKNDSKEKIPTSTKDGEIKNTNFSGLTSISNTTDSTLTLNWTSHPQAVSYKVYNLNSGTPSLMASVNAPSSSISITGLLANTSYTFNVKAFYSTDASDLNNVFKTITTNNAPNAPTGIDLQSPMTGQGLTGTPVIRVSGIKNGDTVKLFTNAGCTTLVASALATAAIIDLTTSLLPINSYTFYALAVNPGGQSSACSTASVAYARIDCPNEYVHVLHNKDVGTYNDFCVMKYEAKCSGPTCDGTVIPSATAVATSSAQGNPWRNINRSNSKIACESIVDTFGNSNRFHLITNPEWMTIARDLERVDANWSPDGNGVRVAGNGVLNRGWVHESNTLMAPTTGTSCLFNTAGNTCSLVGQHEEKRTHTLSNGEEVWDFSGNVWEWVDWDIAPTQKAYNSVNIPTNGWQDFFELDTNVGSLDTMGRETWEPFFNSLGGNEGLGHYYAGTSLNGGNAVRSGQWNYGNHSGVYALALDVDNETLYYTIGFRCAYRP